MVKIGRSTKESFYFVFSSYNGTLSFARSCLHSKNLKDICFFPRLIVPLPRLHSRWCAPWSRTEGGRYILKGVTDALFLTSETPLSTSKSKTNAEVMLSGV